MELEERHHFILAIENLAAARLELIEATKHDTDAERWDNTYQEIDRATDGILRRVI